MNEFIILEKDGTLFDIVETEFSHEETVQRFENYVVLSVHDAPESLLEKYGWHK